ncbi:DUF3363 domain-containing protein [Phenylobacterium sp.]|uniref:DUF3363 domain-containing protein n=1 Tax=Phenylobacterium sp. TaxID=1871053 RepID=UPI002C7B788E|nr:DUF3363 domain-containing protein [Phenylobacterium sp.]HVI32665.1 DUF3363 domain-containing protein [Phenylobacterium sp.]
MEDEFSIRVGRPQHQGTDVPRATRITAGHLARRGRGQRVMSGLRQATSGRRGLRRVIVKARIVQLKVGSAAVRAHLNYLERDAAGPDGEKGRLYDAFGDEADGKAFLERGSGDRHQFRFIVSPEDGADLDLQRYTRELMQRMEADLGTVLDWVAVDHADTAHPHTHIVIRGRTDRGSDLLIAQDYITEGLRLRARELATEDLGVQTPEELRRKLSAEVEQARFTRIDRALLREADGGVADLRPGPFLSPFDRGLREARLRWLEAEGHAHQLSPQVWSLSPDLESQLRRLGERGDMLKAMNRALARQGEARDPASLVTFDEDRIPVVGRVIDKGLAGVTEERAALIVDGLDGKVRRVEVSLASSDVVPIGAIVQTGQGATRADHNIVEVAGGSGLYRTDEHLRRLEMKDLPIPDGAEAADVVRSHVRRLEALRRSRIVERYDGERWRIPADFLDQAAAYEQRRGVVRVMSLLDLETQVNSPGATWLDRELVAREPQALADRGFGAEVKAALRRRSEVLVDRGLGRDTGLGVRFHPGLLSRLTQMELAVAGEAYARARHMHYQPAQPGERVSGTYAEKLTLHSGAFAVVQRSPVDISLVPWRPVIEKHLGRHVAAQIEPGLGVSWSLTSNRSRGLSR